MAANYILPSVEGKYQILIKARDYLTSGLNVNPYGEKTVGKFFVVVDSGAPDLSVSNPPYDAFVSRFEITTVKGTVSKREGTTITGFVYKFGDSTEIPLAAMTDVVIAETAVNGVYNWTGKLDMSSCTDGYFEFRITAKDSYDQTACISLNFAIDE